MSQEEQFPFDLFIGALQDDMDIKREIRPILKAVSQHNIYWIYSSVSTIAEIMKGKEEEPSFKCRSLQAIRIFMEMCEYPVITLIEVYLLPILTEIAAFKGRKSDQLISYYFQQTQGEQDSSSTRKHSLEYVQRAIELIHVGSKIKPQRTVQNQEIKQRSVFAANVEILKQKGIQEPKRLLYTQQNAVKELRKLFMQKLRKFEQHSQTWTEFLLVNLLEQVRSNKKQLLQLRQMLVYGQGYLTSAVINLCQDQLMDLTQNLQMKRKYLSLLNQLVRYGDIQAIIMIKNSEFVPSIVAHFSKLPGHLGTNQGQNIYPQVKASKQVKKEFYVDFLRCLETWAISMPEDYDSQEFSIKSLFKLLKQDKKFKFPENIHILRYQKQLEENIIKNKERNDKLIQMLQNLQESKQTSNKTPLSKVSNILQRTTLLAPSQLQNRLQQARKAMKDIQTESTADKAFKILTSFKQNWITYLQALDLQGADELKLQTLILSGQKCVQEIQLITPFYTSYTKGKLSYGEFKERIRELLDLHNQISVSHIHQGKSKALNASKDMIASKLAKSKMIKSKMGNSKLGGKQLMEKIKAKSKFADSSNLDMSKMMMDRSQMLDRSRQIETSRSRIDKNRQIKEDKSKMSKIPEKQQVEEVRDFSKKKESPISQIQANKNLQSPKKKENRQIDRQEQVTVKKQTRKNNPHPDPQQHIIRVQDYQVNIQKQSQPRNGNKVSSSRQRGSRIMLRRSDSRGSRVQRSSDSQQSQDRRSKSSKKVKQSSLFAGNPKITAGIKTVNADVQFLSDKNQINETIEVNGNIINQGAPTQKRGYNYKEQRSFNNFRDGVQSISSIHSNSVMRVFHNNAEKILDMTENLASELRPQVKRYSNEHVEVVHKVVATPPIGDYYEDAVRNCKLQSPQATPKKKSFQKSHLKSEEAVLIHKNYFYQKEQQKSSIFQQLQKEQERMKAKKQKEKSLVSKQQIKQRNTVNIIKSQNKTQRTSTVQKKVQPISHQNQLKLIQSAKQQQKDKQIQALQIKIRQLQKETLLMKTKLAAKDNQIRSIKSSSKYGSERGFPQFTSMSQSHADKSEKTSLRGSSAGKNKVPITKFEKQIQGQFRQYLQRIKGSTFRKSLLKLKCLVHKTDEIEIGCMSQRSQKNLECTLYITPHRYNLIDFSIAIIHDNCLRTKIVPDQIKHIPSKKQQKVHLTIETLKIPFCLPEIEINYKADSQYSSNYNRLTLPLCFSKFCEIRPLQSDDKHGRQLHYVRSDNFKLNTKIIKLDRIGDSFPNFTILPKGKDRQHVFLTANCKYSDSVFDIMLNLHEKNSFIEGFLKRGELKSMNFLICTYKQILDGSKK